jgi:hypothetical protein
MAAPARTRAERIRDTRALLETEVDCWVATASEDAAPHLVALSFAWRDGRVLLATPGHYRTAANLRVGRRVRLAFGSFRDVAVMDGTASIRTIGDAGSSLLDAFAQQAGFDPRGDPDNVLIEVTPVRVLAWRQENELAGRVLMRGGRWLEEDG